MNWIKRWNWELISAIFVFFIMAILISISGCSTNRHTETVTVNGVVIYKSEVRQDLFLYFTKTKAIDHRTDFSSLTVGEVESVPDANSIEAAVKGAVSAVMGGV